MPHTPDRFPGTREEDEIKMIPQTSDPDEAGKFLYKDGQFKFKDEDDTFNPKISGYALGYIYKLNLKVVPGNGNQISIQPGRCVDDSGSVLLVLTSAKIVDLTVSGKNGLDTGSEAANTWYHVWLIKNLTTGEVAGLFSASKTSPVMPSGFTVKRRIGAIRNNPWSNIWAFWQSGISNRKEYQYYVMAVGHAVITNGTGSLVSPDLVDCSSFIPSTSTRGIFLVWEPASEYGVVLSHGDGVISVSNYPNLAGGKNPALMLCDLNSAQKIWSCGTGDTIDYNVYVLGYIEDIE